MASRKVSKKVVKRTTKVSKTKVSNRGRDTTVKTVKMPTLFTNEPDPLTTEPVQPLIQTPIQRTSGFLDATGPSLDNEYDQADLLVLKDDRVRSILELFSKMTSRAYQGIEISQKADIEAPRILSEDEKEMLKTAESLDDRLNFKKLIASWTKALIKHGDVIEHIETDTSFLDEEFEEEAEADGAITGLTPLPINQMTIIDEQGKIDDPEPTKVITQANIYVVDEENADQTEDDPIVYDKEEIVHISLDNRFNWKDDLINRPTFGIWSDAPLKSIIYLIEWKHNLIRNDMIWRAKLLPREHHMLNMAAFAPENYQGSTFAARLSAAKIAATAEMNLYSASIRTQQPDQGYVTSDDVKIAIIEAKSTNYQRPNEVINQIDGKISSLTGTPEALSGGETMGFSSIEFSGTFVSLRAEEMAEVCADGLERLMWKHIKAIHPAFKIADIKRVKIKTQLILDRDLTERAKVVNILTGSKIFTPTEIRDVFGKEALTDSEQEEINEWIKQTASLAPGKSQEDTAADAEAETGSPTGNQQSKQKRINDNDSTADRAGERGR